MMGASEIHSRRISAIEVLTSQKGDEFIFRVAYVAALKPVPTSGRFEVTSFIVVTLNLEFQLHMLKEESFPTPLKYIDVTRTTHTNLDVFQEKRLDDYWNVDGNRSLSEPWKGFTKFPLKTEKQLRKKERQEWANEKNKARFCSKS